jgi:hypothetical protein
MQTAEQNNTATQTNNNPAPATPEAGTPELNMEIVSREQDQTAYLNRFDETFKLEGDIVGAVRKKASKKGAVTLSLLPMRAKAGNASLATVSGKTGKELEAYRRTMADKLKGEAGVLVSRIVGSQEWTGRNITLNAQGNRISIQFDRVTPMVIAQAAKMTPEDAIKFLAEHMGTTPNAIAEGIGMELPAPEQPSESQTGPGEPKANGEAHVETPKE